MALGITYTAEELAIWQDRAINGPFKTADDAFTNSPGDWNRIVANAAIYIGNTSVVEWVGPLPYGAPFVNSQSNVDESPGWNWYAAHNMMCAALVDLVNETSVYTAAIKNSLLTEAAQGELDFSDTVRFHASGLSDIMWSMADWQIKLLYCYDFVGRSNFSAGELVTLDAWFIDGATWFYTVLASHWDDVITGGRGGPFGSYTFSGNAGNLIPDNYYTIKLGGPQASVIGTYHNNRRAAMCKYVATTGCLLDNATLRDEGIWVVKEFLAFFWYGDGTWTELHRASSGVPDQGLKYGNNTLMEMIETAHILKINGYEDLFTYSTQFGLGGTDSPGIDKSLEWACLAVKNYVDLTKSTHVAHESAIDLYRHTYRDAGNYNGGPSLNYINPLAIMDVHYTGEGDVFKEAYYPIPASSYPYPSNPISNGPYSIFTGVAGTLPGTLFMYADVGGATPEAVTPQPYRRLRGKGALPLNSKYITP